MFIQITSSPNIHCSFSSHTSFSNLNSHSSLNRLNISYSSINMPNMLWKCNKDNKDNRDIKGNQELRSPKSREVRSKSTTLREFLRSMSSSRMRT